MTYIILVIVGIYLALCAIIYPIVRWMEKVEEECDGNIITHEENKVNLWERNQREQELKQMKQMLEEQKLFQAELELQREIQKTRDYENFPTDKYWK